MIANANLEVGFLWSAVGILECVIVCQLFIPWLAVGGCLSRGIIYCSHVFLGEGCTEMGGFTDWEACKMGGFKERGLEKEGGL